MKKLLTMFLIITLVFVSTNTAFAAKKSSNENGKTHSNSNSISNSTTQTKSADSVSNQNDQTNQTYKKKFKDELNEQKKQLLQEKGDLNKEKNTLQQQYESLLASGDTTGATVVLEKLNNLNTQITELQSSIKQAINERYMIVKTMYSEEELAAFESASDVIKQMNQDASTLEAGSVTVNDNLIKFDAPAYLKGGVTLVPIRAISEELGAEVTWDQETGTIKMVKGDKTIEMQPNSSTILVNGVAVEMTTSTEVTCGRTYLPLRFLAELLDFDVTWDGENEQISIDDQTEDSTSTLDNTNSSSESSSPNTITN